jgi:hypothetical protein
MNSQKDDQMERILAGRPELAYTLDQVKQEATRRAVGTNAPHLVCMDRQGKLHIRVDCDFLNDVHSLKALVYCDANGKRRDIKQ